MAVTIVEEARPITGGVDTHADTHVAAALEPVGGLLGVREFPATAAGYAGLLGCSASGSSRPPRPATPACWAGWADSGPCAWSGSKGPAVTARAWPAT